MKKGLYLTLFLSLALCLVLADDHSVVVGGRYSEQFKNLSVSAKAEAQSNRGYTQTWGEVNAQQSFGRDGEIHGTVGARNDDLYLSGGGKKFVYGEGYNISAQAEASVDKNQQTQRVQLAANKTLEQGSLYALVGEENLKLFASGVLFYFQKIQGFDVNETAWLNWQNNYFSSQLVAETAKQISDLVKVYLRGRLSNLEQLDLLVRAVLSNTTYDDAKVNGYAQGALSQAGLVWEAIVNAYKLINSKYDTNAEAGVRAGTPFFNVRTSFKDSGADFQARWNTTLNNYGLKFGGSAVASQEVSEHVGGSAGLRFEGLNLKLYEQGIFGNLHYSDTIENGNVGGYADLDFSTEGARGSLTGHVNKNLSQNLMASDEFYTDLTGQVYNRAALQGQTYLSKILANYLLEVISNSGYGTSVNAKADGVQDNLRLGVRAFLENQSLGGVGAYVGTEGYYNGYKYKAGISGDVNSSRTAEVRARGEVNSTVSGYDYSSFGEFVSDLSYNDYLTIGAVLTNRIQTLRLTANKNLRGTTLNSIEANYSYQLSNGYVLNLKANKTDGRRAYLEGNISRIAGTQSVLVYFTVDELGAINFRTSS